MIMSLFQYSTYEKHTQTVMYCYVMRLCSHSVDHKYYNVVECHDLGVVKRRAASVFRIGMEKFSILKTGITRSRKVMARTYRTVRCHIKLRSKVRLPFYKQADVIQHEDMYPPPPTPQKKCMNKPLFKIMHRSNQRVVFMKVDHELRALCSKCENCRVTQFIYTVINM